MSDLIIRCRHLFLVLYETGGVPFEILEPVLEKCTPEQLLRIEECNPVRKWHANMFSAEQNLVATLIGLPDQQWVYSSQFVPVNLGWKPCLSAFP